MDSCRLENPIPNANSSKLLQLSTFPFKSLFKFPQALFQLYPWNWSSLIWTIFRHTQFQFRGNNLPQSYVYCITKRNAISNLYTTISCAGLSVRTSISLRRSIYAKSILHDFKEFQQNAIKAIQTKRMSACHNKIWWINRSICSSWRFLRSFLISFMLIFLRVYSRSEEIVREYKISTKPFKFAKCTSKGGCTISGGEHTLA